MKTKAPSGIYPGELFGSVVRGKKEMYYATGEFRAPKAGEYYLSGAIIEAYRAKNDIATKYWIAAPVGDWYDGNEHTDGKESPVELALYNLVRAVTKEHLSGNPYRNPAVRHALQVLTALKRQRKKNQFRLNDGTVVTVPESE